MPRSFSKAGATPRADPIIREPNAKDPKRLASAWHDLEHMGLLVEDGPGASPHVDREPLDILLIEIPEDELVESHWRDGSCLF